MVKISTPSVLGRLASRARSVSHSKRKLGVVGAGVTLAFTLTFLITSTGPMGGSANLASHRDKPSKEWRKDDRAEGTIDTIRSARYKKRGSTTTIAPENTTPESAPVPQGQEQGSSKGTSKPAAPKPKSESKSKSTSTTKPRSGSATPAPTSGATGAQPKAQSGWVTTFFDDFNGNSVNESAWGIYEGRGNAGIGTRDRSAISGGNGALKITGNGWSAGGMGSKHEQTYGLYEIRARLDRGRGYNQAILLWPSSGRWPIDGEIDIAEIFDGDNVNKMGSFVHWGANNKQLWHLEYGDFSQWHTYAVDWQPDRLTFYLDGRVIWTVTEPAAIPHNPHFLAIQLDVSEHGQKDSGTALHVDWVRISKKA